MDLNQNETTLLEHIREAREKGETIPPKATELNVGVEGAYRVKATLREGWKILGYKLGLVSPAKQAQHDPCGSALGSNLQD